MSHYLLFQIDEEDSVSKMVCHKCCSLAVKLYQYRQTALANDKALKVSQLFSIETGSNMPTLMNWYTEKINYRSSYIILSYKLVIW